MHSPTSVSFFCFIINIFMIRELAKKLLQLPQIQGKPFRPIIVSDIDGVLVRGNNPIPGTL